MLNIPNRYALACQVTTNIRFKTELTWQELKDIFKGQKPYNPNLQQKYLLAFFEGCCNRKSTKLLKAFMSEQNISRQEILNIFYKLPQTRGETFDMQECIRNGKF